VRSVVVASVIAGALSGCGTSQEVTPPPGVSASPSESASASASPAALQQAAGKVPANAPPWVLSTDGLGPYRLGARADELRAAGLLGQASPVDAANCPDLYNVAATGVYEGTLVLLVRHNVLVEIGTAGGDEVRTPAGASVGGTFERVKKLYGSRGSSKKDSSGKEGFIVPVGDRVILFASSIHPGVGWMAAGFADQTEHNFLTGSSC
jgi:hypothetical protein